MLFVYLMLLCSTAYSEIPVSDDEIISFDAYLNNKLVGTHVFVIKRTGNSINVNSNMHFKAKLWGILPVNYSHQSTEKWEKGCLVRLDSQTEKRGEILKVSASAKPFGFVVESANNTQVLKGCVRSFAYWDYSMLEGSQLLNTENGKMLDVEIETTYSQIDKAKSLVIRNPESDIYLQYAADGQWLSLKSKLKVGGDLHYIRQ